MNSNLAMVLILTLIFFLLSGCSNAPVKTVNVGVHEKCETPIIEKPKTPLQDAEKSNTAFNKAKKALAEIEFRKAYEKKLEAANKACQ